MKAELKVGDKVLVPQTIAATDHASGTYLVRFVGHDIWFSLDELIPIPEPLPAPTCEGPWLQKDGNNVYPRDIVEVNGKLGFWRGTGHFDMEYLGTWHGPIDPRLAGVEVEEEKPEPKSLADEIAATDSRDAYLEMLAEAIDELKAQLGEVQKLAEDNCRSVVRLMDAE